jgi:CRP/FNR family cyclic AMP-dependent transcriptional regulator
MQQSRIQALQNSSMFGAVSEDVVERIVQRAEEVSIPAGDYFFRQDEGGSTAYLLESGEVDVLKTWAGKEFLLHKLSAGDCFGEVALLDFGRRSASIRAACDCRSLAVGAAALREIAEYDAKQFALIYMNLGRELGRRLRAADDRVFRMRFESGTTIEDYSYAAI